MTGTDEESLDDVAAELSEQGESTITFDFEDDTPLEEAAGLLTGLAELEDVQPNEVTIELQA